MNFQFTDDHIAVQQLAGGLFADFCSDDRLKSLHDKKTTFDAELWRKLVETGLLSLALPEKWKGSGLGAVELGLVLEQQGRYLAHVPLWRHQIAMLAIAAFGSSALQNDVIESLASGEEIATIATEAEDGSSVQASVNGNEWVLNGTANSILTSGDPRYLLLPATENGQTRFFVVDLRGDGIGRTEGITTNYEPVSNLRLSNVKVSGEAALSDDMTLEWFEERIAFSVATLQLGVTVEALRRTSIYLGERHQFGRPIGSFQAVANRMADAYIETELLRSAQLSLAWQLDNKELAIAAARVAKFQACQTGHIVGHTALHYHGGMGQDLTYPIHRFFLWAKALELTGGGGEAQLARIADNLAPQIGEES